MKSKIPTGISAYRDPVTGDLAGSYPQPAMTDREILKLANEMASNRDGYGVAFYNDVLIAFARKLMQAEAPRMEAEAERLRKRDAQWIEFAMEVGKRVGCLASTFPDANDHVLRKLPPNAEITGG